MNVTALINLLNQSPDVNDRSVFYRQNLRDHLHNNFFQLIAGYQAGTLQFENNALLSQIKSLLDESFQEMGVDTDPIGSILSQLTDASVTLEAVAGDSELPTALQTTDTLYSSAMTIFDEVNGIYQEQLQIVEQRQQLNIGDPGTPGYNFAMNFDTELGRDAAVILFLKDTFLSFTDKLRALRSRIAQMIASSGNNTPPGDLNAVVGLLTSSEVVGEFATQTIQSLQNARASLFNLGQGLINRQIQLNDNPDLQQLGSTLENLISDTMSKSANFDSLLNQLKTLATGFTATAEDPQLPAALSLASTCQQNAKTLHEEAHLLNLAFNELDAFGKQLDGMQPAADELTFYSDYVLTIDKFHLLTNYVEGICDSFDFITKKFSDLFDYFLNDPHFKVQQFNDNLPFALLPVRLETRFMTIKHVCNNISYTSVNDVLRSDTDIQVIKNTKQTNTLMETAAPIGGLQLQTVSAPQQIPDQHELWVRIYPDDIAVHTHEDLLSQSELNDAQVYWNEKWKAVGDPTYELGAWRALCSSYGSRRAAWIISQTGPINGPNPNTGTAPLSSLATSPALPPLTLRPASWSQQPQTRILPERFVVRVYSAGIWREVAGQTVPSPLPIGFDPMDPYANYLGQNGTEINMPPDLRWLTHFEEAEKVGMGIRVPLQGNEITLGFDRLLVLGLKLDLNGTAATQALETLFNNHHYATGLALVPQGTPTNNTDDLKSGYAGLEPGYEESYKTELGTNQFTTTSIHYDKSDGQRLAEALGVNPGVFQHIANSNAFDVQESMTMTRALWPATLGYYMKNMLTPSLVQANIDDTKSFFGDYVQGRGLIPAFRVRNQPYGVLTSTVYSKWAYSDPYTYDAKLHTNILEKLRKYWILHFFPDVKRITSTSNTPPDALLVNVMGLNASSVEFHQRITIGDMLASNIMQYLAAANQPQPNPAIANPTAANLLDALYKSYQMESFSYFNTPRIFSMAFAKSQRLLNGPVIDSLPLSEKRTIEKLGNGTANYIDWLAGSTIPYIRAENFSNVSSQAVQPPKALLYLLLRHAWMLEYLDTAHCLLTSVGAVSVDAWHNHELIKMTGGTTPEFATAEQTSMLHGFVRAEVQYENELQIEEVMRNLSTNQQYQNSGMTPEQFQIFLRDQSAAAVDDATATRYTQRLNAYNVDQAQWSYLTGKYAQLSSELTVADYIRAQLNSGDPCFTKLRETNDALTRLSALPTARLERCFAEHLDTCAYRLDSWLNGLVSKRLLEQRNASPGGIYLGAYGILENPKPNLLFPGIHVVNISNADSWNSAVAKMGQRKMLDLTPSNAYPANVSGNYIINPPKGVQPASFIYLGDDPHTKLIEDPESGQIVSGQQINPSNEGFILAPSLNQAVASAVMRAGYVAHKGSALTAETMAVTLTSDRVRTALYYLEGIRNGQDLSTMLGYQFERGLHERQQAFLPGLDSYIAEFREAYPLLAGAVINNPAGMNSGAQSRQVTDGLKLLQAYAKVAPPWYLNISGIYSGNGYTADGTKIVLEIEKIKGDLDAIGDLLLSEAIYQVTRGNHERAGSVLQALGYGANIPEPEIIRTPRHADTFTHRCVVQFSPATTANGNWTGTSIRANAEPALNNWLASQLPPPADIRIVYDFAGNTSTLSLDMIDLNLQPIDLLSIFTSSGSNQSADATELSKRIILKARAQNSLSDNVEITISYGSRAGLSSIHRTIFELTPILQSLSRIVSNSRILNPDDFVTPGELASMTAPAGALDSAALLTRLNTARAIFVSRVGDLEKVYTPPSPAVTKRDKADELDYTNGIPGNANTVLNALRAVLIDASEFGVTTAIPDSQSDTTESVRNLLVQQADQTFNELNKRLTEINSKMTDYTTLVNSVPNPGAADHKRRVSALIEIAKLLFGRSFNVFTNFTLHNQTEVQNAVNYTSNFPAFYSNAGLFPVEAWMSGVARVRPRMADYHKQMLLAESVRYDSAASAPFEFTKQNVLQFPVVDNQNGSDRWIGMKLQANYKIPLDAISMVIESNNNTSGVPTCGVVIDEWPEQIPVDEITAGIAINYDQPSSEAPQTIILAVTPEIKSYWAWNDLMDTLNETIEMAQIRAVEPDTIQKSPLSQVLPALLAQMSGDGTNTTPSLDLARNIVSVPNGFDDPIDVSNY